MSDNSFKVEEVDSVNAPPKARVDVGAGAVSGAMSETVAETLERKKDYLEGFLSQKPAPITADGDEALQEAIIAALKEIYDPEIPVNIYDLGLIYNVEVNGGHALVTMTLTTPNCPVAESMPQEVELRVGSVPGVGDAEVMLVWEPAWNPANMSDEARLELGML